MKSYIIPTVEIELDIIVLHCGTSNLRRMVTPEVIAFEIVALGTTIKTEKNAIIISDIIARKGQCKDKERDTNKCFKK